MATLPRMTGMEPHPGRFFSQAEQSLRRAVSSLPGVAIVNASLIVGWGGFGYYREPKLLLIAILLTIEVFTSRKLETTRIGHRWVARQSWVFLFAPVWLLMNGASAFHARAHGIASPSISWIGIALIAAGLLLRIWSAATLGEFFSLHVTVHPGQTLIMSGPYRFCRHPAYLGTLTQLVGFTLAFQAQACLFALALFSVALIFRIRDEESLLREIFPQHHKAYRAAVPLLVPVPWQRKIL